MKTATLLAFTLLLPPAFTCAGLAPAAPQARQADAQNAALLYYQLWLSISAEDNKLISDWYGTGGLKLFTDPIPQDVLDALVRNAATLDRLAAATAMPACDFGLDWNLGLHMPLPHLAKMRMTARLLAADSVRLRLDKRPDLAAARLACIFNLANHCAGDGVIISSLVGAAIGALGDTSVSAHLDSGGFDAAQRAVILEPAKALRASRFNLFAAVSNEERISVDWVQANYRSQTAGKDFLKDYGTSFTTPDAKDEPEMRRFHAAMLEMDGPALAAEINKLRPYFKAMREAWNAPDAQDQLGALERRVRAGDFGSIGKLMAPAFAKVKASQLKVEKILDEAIARLEQPVPAPAEPATVK